MSVEAREIVRYEGFASGLFTESDRRDVPITGLTDTASGLAVTSKNVACHETKLRKRKGYVELADAGANLSITSIHSGNNNIMVTDSAGDIYTLSGSTLTNKTTPTPVLANVAVSWASLNNLDICNDGVVTKKWNGTTVADLGGSPPTGNLLATYQNRLWIGSSSSSLLRFSEVENPEDWTIFTAGIEVDKGSREKNVAIVPVSDRLVVFKESSIHHILGFNVETFQRIPANSQVGCVSKNSIVEVSDSVNPRWNGLYWCDGSGVYFSQDLGITVEKISDRIESEYNLWTPKSAIYASKVASYNEIWFCHRTSGSANNRAYSWNYRLGCWHPEYLSPPFRCISEVLVSGERVTYSGDSGSATNGKVYTLSGVETDDGEDIDFGFQLHKFTAGSSGTKKVLRRIRIIHNRNQTSTIQIVLQRDRANTVIDSTSQAIDTDGITVFDYNNSAFEFLPAFGVTGQSGAFAIDLIELEYVMKEAE